MAGIKNFVVDTAGLSLKERRIFTKLIGAAKLIAPLYPKQKNNEYPGANFYPHGAKKEIIEKAAEENPAILSPYTFVEGRRGGVLKAVPFHIRFKKELKPIARLVSEAAELTDDKSFRRYLLAWANFLLDSNDQRKEMIWFKRKPAKFGFVIGPIERYLDKLFFIKCAYQSWVGILDEKETGEADRFQKMILASRKKILPGSEKVPVSKIHIRIDETALFSGLIADFMFTGTNLPNNVSLMEKYGSNLTIFKTSLRLKFQESHLPIFKALFSRDLQRHYSEEELFRGSLRCILLHEIAHSLIRYRDAEKRLGDLFPVIDELLAYTLGIKAAGTLFLKDAIPQKDLEAILIMYLSRNFTWWQDSLKNPAVLHYATGAAIAQNFFMREGALKKRGGVLLPDFTKLFICVTDLARMLENYLALGTYKETKKFIKEYHLFSVFETFFKALK